MEMMRTLLENGADVEKVNEHRWTPLVYAIQEGKGEMVRVLCEYGADVEKLDNLGTAPLILALENAQENDLVAGAYTRPHFCST